MRLESETNETSGTLPPLPFKYERTFDPLLAQYSEWRISPVRIVGQKNQPASDDIILARVKRGREKKDWFFQDYWREKEQPQEELEFDVNGKPITLYNFCKDQLISNEHISRLQQSIKLLSSHFPQALGNIRWILIDDTEQTSLYGNPEKFPLNGQARKEWQMFRFLRRGMQLMPHRIAKVSNFEGTFVHEASHLIQDDFLKDWFELFQWEWCQDHMDQWEFRTPPDGSKKRLYNKVTRKMAPQAQFPLQPEKCINYYAKLSPEEDICESIVAYIYDPELLKTISPEKFEILAKHDANGPLPPINIQRIPKERIRLPEINPETVYFYIRESDQTE